MQREIHLMIKLKGKVHREVRTILYGARINDRNRLDKVPGSHNKIALGMGRRTDALPALPPMSQVIMAQALPFSFSSFSEEQRSILITA